MKFRIAWRELGRNKAFFAMCCCVVALGSALSYYGMRIIISAYALTSSSAVYDYKDFFLMEGWFVFSMSFLLSCEILLLAFLSLPDSYVRNIKIFNKLGGSVDDLTVMLLLQLFAVIFPFVAVGILLGETVLKFCPDLLVGKSLPLVDAFSSIWRIVLLYVLVAILVSVISATSSSRLKRVRVRTLPFVKLREKTNLLFVRMGMVSFLRRKRPILSQLLLCLTMVFFIVLEGCTVYFEVLDRNFYQSTYSYSVTVDGKNHDAYLETVNLVKQADEYIYWREYRTSFSMGASDIVTRSDAQVIVLSDEDFSQLALYAGVNPDNVQSLLQNYVYDKEVFNKISVIDGGVSDKEYFLNSGYSFTIGALLDQVPQRFVSGYEDLFVYKIFFKQSEFTISGDSDIFTARFFCKDMSKQQLLVEKLQNINGVEIADLKDKYQAVDDIAVLNNILPTLLLVFIPLLVLSALLFFLRDVKALRRECSILRSLGAGKGALFVKSITEYLALATLILAMIALPSLVLLKIAHFSALGNAVYFFLPWKGFAVSLLLIYVIALAISFISLSDKKDC